MRKDVQLHQEIDLFSVPVVRTEHLHLHAGPVGEEVYQYPFPTKPPELIIHLSIQEITTSFPYITKPSRWCHFQHPGPYHLLQLRIPAELHPEADQRLHAGRE